MALDVEIPDPPVLHGPQDPGDYEAVDELENSTDDTYRREDMVQMLEDGAWEAAFDEWAETTYLTEAEFQVVLDLDLIDEFDFYWNPSAEDVGYRAPTLSEDTLELDDETIEQVDVEGIEEELDSLGRTVSEVLENDYIHRDGEEFGYSWE